MRHTKLHIAKIACALSLLVTTGHLLLAGERTISVFVALADNEHQGIVPVPKAIGKGDDPDHNLYWGTAEGLQGHFDKSTSWNLTQSTSSTGQVPVLRTRIYRHKNKNAVLYARAYRGQAIQQCIQDFETAVKVGATDLVVYIGHNGLMNFTLPSLSASSNKTVNTDCVVLCCKSEPYFKERLLSASGRPILLTTQLMYPGSFILHDVLEEWLRNADLKTIRATAAAAYAKNQKITNKAALGVFAELTQKNQP